MAFNEGLFKPKSMTWCDVLAVFICWKLILTLAIFYGNDFFLNETVVICMFVQTSVNMRSVTLLSLLLSGHHWLVALPSGRSGHFIFFLCTFKLMKIKTKHCLCWNICTVPRTYFNSLWLGLEKKITLCSNTTSEHMGESYYKKDHVSSISVKRNKVHLWC